MKKIACPIPGCTHEYDKYITGWFQHVTSMAKHPHWHPELTDPSSRATKFQFEFPEFLQNRRTSSMIPKAVEPQLNAVHEKIFMMLHSRDSEQPIGIIAQFHNGWLWEDFRVKERSSMLFGDPILALKSFLSRQVDDKSTQSVAAKF